MRVTAVGDLAQNEGAEPTPAGMATTPRVLDRVVWRDAAMIWLAQHALLIAITYLTVTLINTTSAAHVAWASFLDPWYGWDGANYAVIATTGYNSLWTAAFFPLLPAVEHALAPLAGGQPALAGLLLANAAELAAFALFRVLAERELDRDTARRALLYLAFFPTAFFLAAPYTESIFLLTSVAAFLALRSRRWLLAGALVAVATLIRAPGLLLTVPLAAEGYTALREASTGRTHDAARPWYRQFEPRLAASLFVGLALPVATLGLYAAYLYGRFGTWTAISQAQASGGGRGLNWPWVGFLRLAKAFAEHGIEPDRFQPHMLLDLAFTLAFIALTILAVRRLSLPYALYTLACLLQVICTPSHNWYAQSSNMRYMLVVFPIFFLFGRLGARRNVELAMLLTMVPLLVLFVAIFVSHGWVA